MAVASAKLPASSVTVKVTVFAPKSAHVNVVTSKPNNKLGVNVQLSVDPLSICKGVILALPEASN